MKHDLVLVPTAWLDNLKDYMDTIQVNLAEFTLDGTDEYNKRAVEFMLAPLSGHIQAIHVFYNPPKQIEVQYDEGSNWDYIFMKAEDGELIMVPF